MKNVKKLNNKLEEEKIIFEDLRILEESDTENISNKVSKIFDDVEKDTSEILVRKAASIEKGGTEVSEILNYVLSGEFGLEHAEEISDRIMEELIDKGII